MERWDPGALRPGPSMPGLAATYDPRAVEAESRALWSARGVPPADGPLGPPTGPLVRLVSGPVEGSAGDLATALRLVRLDAEARWLAHTGRRASGVLRRSLRDDVGGAGAANPAGALGVWFGGGTPLAPGERDPALRRALLERLASDRLLGCRSVPIQVCPSCRRPNSPESVIYQPEEGSAYLVRFPLQGSDPPVSLLVWTDAAWKLLATSAVLVHPKLTYVVLRRTGGENAERVLCSKGSLARFAEWLPDATWEVLEERTGASLAGTAYIHPLGVEHPALTNLPAPGGTVVASEDVEDSGTGVLTLTPAHGVVDAEVGHRLGLPGWPVLGIDGEMTRVFQHKYAGLSREDAESFILRDLIDDGAIFAQLSVRRGVPRCARCGTALLWTPARVWSLDAGRLPPDRLQLFRRVLPGVVVAEPGASLPWPVSEFATEETEGTMPLSECTQCETLAPDTASGPCTCGARRSVVRRRLLAEFEEALQAWATVDTFPDGTGVRLVVPERRRGPALLHHLVAMHAARRRPGELRLVPVATVPPVELSLGASEPLDAVRLALLRAPRLSAGRTTFESNRRQESERLRKVWGAYRFVLERLHSSGAAPDLGAATAHFTSLLEEDRAFLSQFERMRLDVQKAYEEGRIPEALERLDRFFEGEVASYLRLVGPRLAPAGAPPTKQSALRVLQYALPVWAALIAPSAPFTGEALWSAFQGGEASVFESALPPAQESWIDARLETSYARWLSAVRAVDRARPALGLARDARIPAVALEVPVEETGAALRAQLPILTRLLGAETVEVASPERPFGGLKVEYRPKLSELQKAYGAQASRLVRLVQGLPTKRLQEGLKTGSISLVFDGASVSLTPAMFEVSEGLGEGTVPVPWAGGQIYLTLPASAAASGPRPVLSLDAHRLVASIERRLATLPLDAKVDVVVVRAAGPVREELARQLPAIARRLHVPHLRLDQEQEEFPPGETHEGTTGRGLAWSVWIPGAARTPKAPKAHRRSAGRRRAPAPPAPTVVPEELLEFLSEERKLRDAGVQGLLDDFDATAAGPLLGPTKVGLVWDLGLRDRGAIAAAPFAQLEGLPGFGSQVARELVRSAGGEPPPAPVWVPRPRPPPNAPDPEVVVVRESEPPPEPSPPPAPPPPPVARLRAPEPPAPPPVVPTIVVPELAPSAPSRVEPPAEEVVEPVLTEEELSPPAEPAGSASGTSTPGPDPGSVDDAATLLAPDAEPADVDRAPADTPPEPGPTEVGEGAGSPDERTREASAPTGTGPDATGAASELSSRAPNEPDDESEAGAPATLPENDPGPEIPPVASETPSIAPAIEPEEKLRDSDLPALEPETLETPTTVPDLEELTPAAPEPDEAPAEPPGTEERHEAPSEPEAGLTASRPSDRAPDPGPVEIAPPQEIETPPESMPAPEGAPESPEGVGELSPDVPAPDALVPSLEEVDAPPTDPEPEGPAAPDRPSDGPSEMATAPAAAESPSVEPPETPSAAPAPALTEPLAPAEEPMPEDAAVRGPDAAPVPDAPAVEEGVIYLEGGPSGAPSSAFLEATSAGHRGVWLTRESPDRARLYLREREVEHVWISSLPRPGVLRPNDLAGISQRILTALQAGGATAVLFEGVEYLVSLHGTERTVPVLLEIDAVARSHHARVWITLNPELLAPGDLEALRTRTDSRAQPTATPM